jgi:hypothetical protein
MTDDDIREDLLSRLITGKTLWKRVRIVPVACYNLCVETVLRCVPASSSLRRALRCNALYFVSFDDSLIDLWLCLIHPSAISSNNN